MFAINKALGVSIVIPVYNEEDSLNACLLAISAQTVRPYEVIVVDNNSSDNTVMIAKRFPFVTVLQERRQGVVHARNCGFNAARGDIIGRIDADTIISQDWVETVQLLFENDKLDAVSGSVRYEQVAWSRLITRIDLAFRRHFARRLGREVALQGANMALRRSSWRSVRSRVCLKSGLHEDFDLAIHLTKAGKMVRFDESLRAIVCNRRIESSLPDFYCYVMLAPRTYAKHGLKSGRYMYSAVVLSLISFWLLKLLYRGYDSETGRFYWRSMFTASQVVRVNPATFVE